MTTIALGSIRGAPGVTTTALLLASRLAGSVLVEADLAGGVLAVRYPLNREPGLTTLAAARGQTPTLLLDHAQMAGGVPAVVGPDSPTTANALWRSAGRRLMKTITEAGPYVVADLGRLQATTPIVPEADLVILVIQPVAEQIVGLTHAEHPTKERASGEVVVALCGGGPYRATDVEITVDLPVVAHLPFDPQTANHLLHGTASPARIARSRLGRAVAALGDDIERSAPHRQAVTA